jgi:hypothetical protein
MSLQIDYLDLDVEKLSLLFGVSTQLLNIYSTFARGNTTLHTMTSSFPMLTSSSTEKLHERKTKALQRDADEEL